MIGSSLSVMLLLLIVLQVMKIYALDCVFRAYIFLKKVVDKSLFFMA